MTDEEMRIESFKLKNFLRLGYSIHEAEYAIKNNIDWHDVEAFIEKQPSCSLTMALKIAG